MKSGACHRFYIIILFLLALQVACVQQQSAKKSPVMSDAEKEEMLLRVNKYLVEKDIELMNAYASQRGWDIEISETGLLYDIYERNDASRVQVGERVSIKYEVSLIDGTVCYTSERDGSKEFILGRSQEISGLEQGLFMMGKGEKARLIIPPHLAYGLIGDEKRIPARAIIVYQLELLEIN
jgi:FKBP-type peptidyl-prolyl cis-trans isomerase